MSEFIALIRFADNKGRKIHEVPKRVALEQCMRMA